MPPVPVEPAGGRQENFSVREVLCGLVDALDQGRGLVTIAGFEGPSVVVAGDRRTFKAVVRECLLHALNARRGRPVTLGVKTDAVSWGRYQVRVEVSFVRSWFGRCAGEGWLWPAPPWRRTLRRVLRRPEHALELCRRQARKLGGAVHAVVAAGRATLAVEVPFGAAGMGSTSPLRVRRPCRRILLVEDEHYNRLVIGGLLRDLRCQVDWAADGAGALDLVARHPYDAVLVDWCLPDTDGGTLARQLAAKLLQPGAPLIAITGHVAPGRLNDCRAAGMAAIVFKPVSREKLLQVLGEWLVFETPVSTAA